MLEQVRTTIAVAPDFDPSTSERQIRIMASDYTAAVLLAPAIARFSQAAPHMVFEIQDMGTNPAESLERGFVDLLVTVDFAVSADHPSELLFCDDYVVVGDKGNPAMSQEMTSELYESLGHVTTRFGRKRVPAFDDWYMKRNKQESAY